MTSRSEGRTGWRDSAWNRQPAGACAVGRSALTLEGGLARGARSELRGDEETAEGSASVLRFLAAPRLAPVRHRYTTGNRWLMRTLEWVTAKTWALAVLDDMCTWFEDGSVASRMGVGCAAAATMAVLLTVHAAALYGLQALILLPVFAGHGMLALVTASFLLGVTVLPAVLGHVLGVLLRFYVLLNLCTLAAVLGYGGWLLYSYAKL